MEVTEFFKRLKQHCKWHSKGNDERMTEEMKKLKKLAVPIMDFLNKHYTPYARVEITENYVKIVEEKMSIPKK